MIQNKTIIFILIFFTSIVTFSQEIITDRPDQTESTVTVGKQNFQIESGIIFQNTKDNSVNSFFGPSTLLRYGISDGVELRFVSQYESTEIGLNGANIDYSGFNDLELGVKIQVLKKENSNTEIAFLSHIIIPTGKENLTTNNLGVVNKLAVSHVLIENVSVGYNIGYDNIEKKSSITYSVALGIRLSNTVGFYIEPYGAWGESNTFESNLDTGFTYLVNNNFQLDVSYGVGLNNDMKYLSAGFSWIIPKFLAQNKL